MWGQTEITSLSDITDPTGQYRLTSDVSGSGHTSIATFSGTLEAAINPETHMPYRITGLSAPLFTTLTGTVKNLVLEGVSISGNSGNTGAIACTANGEARIYNVGILSGSVGGTGNTGGLVGLLGGTARVINCYSFATISGGSNVGGIVGNNSTTTTAGSINTMVMNCMFYGDITGGTTVSPVYGGTNINNLNNGGLNTFNYYAYDELKTQAISNNKYNCALAVEQKYLNRFEFYRLLLNSNKKLAAFYATGNVNDGNQMLKWVLETADRTIDNPKPYPILKAQGYYPSIVNPDIEHAPDSASVGRNKGGKLPLPRNTLTVTISSTQTTGGQTKPSGATITTSSLTLTRTDKDFDRFNFNYDKVQLPYYNDVGTGNYTGNRVVTGWKITAITAIDDDPYTSENYPTTGITDFPNHNYADRKSSNKDLYSVSGRVFSQGAYFDVPYGVTSITIEPYWGKVYYIADQYYDVVYSANYNTKQGVSQTGTQVNTSSTLFNGQKVETSIERALNNINNNMGGWGPTVYDNVLVLVGNLHLNTVPQNGTTPFTMTSVDMDNDHEPDYSLIYHHTGRSSVCPIRFDFLNIPGTAQAQKPNGASLICNFTIFKTRGWFEVTNTSSFYSSQLEYENLDNNTKTDAPLILLGGVVDQFVSTQSKAVTGKTIYIHVGGNVWIQEFGMGTHSDGSQSTPHVPVSVTGGEFPGFYLTGTYNANATIREDNAECYISGGYFHEVAGASQEGIKGNVHWQIYNADIDQFFGGGINEAKPIQGTVTTDIYNSHVTLFCGGPKFGNMTTGKTVTTNAEGCTFGNYFGAGYGGNSYSRKKYYDNSGNQNWTTLQNYYVNDKGEYYNGTSTGSSQTSGKDYGKKGPGVATDFDYEFFVWSSGTTGARLFVKFVSFSLAQCDNVSSTLKKCTINENFYGGGSLGKVSGTATSELEDCTVMGNAFGAGYSATLPTIPVRNGGFTTNPNYNQNSGMFEPGVYTGTTEYTWKQVASYPAEGGAGFDGTQVITTLNLDKTNLGSVGNVQLTIKGTTQVKGSVYGGGEESVVTGNTVVNIIGGTIGTTGKGGAIWGNVYGGGKGKEKDVVAGLVKGNTKINISQASEEKPTAIYHNVYGGGAYGSVGDFTYDGDTGMPTGLKPETTGGKTTVTITGGTIGTNGHDNGMVFGSSRGDVAIPEGDDEPKVDPNDRMAWVYSTHVTIGDASAETAPAVKGSVYGSGENGHTFQNTTIDINKGTIGITDPEDEDGGAAYAYRGNVYGGGCGTDKYDSDGDDIKDAYNPLAGIVKGTTTINITGGHVVHNVYGAGAMGSVGGGAEANSGKTTINITGGRIGYDGDGNGHIFGAARGEFGVSTAASGLANVRETEVNINYTTTPSADNEDKDVQLIAGSVFGGGEAGTVKGDVTVKMTGGLVLNDVYGGGALADTQTSNWDATANENAGGWTDADKKSALHTTLVRLTGGDILGEAYGGGLGEPGRPAYVWGDVLVDLNGTTTSGETGTAIDATAKGCAVNQVFGCNNVNGTPKGEVLVHVYATQNKYKSQMDAKVKGSYDVTAVYGGGNLAAYEPAGGKTTTNSTNVIIDGCGLTSIQTVYGGGNAASTPATNVTVNGTYEIEELFGGGNGKDKLSDGRPNPGANVGYKNYTIYKKVNDEWVAEDDPKYDTKEERTAESSDIIYGTGQASINVFGGTVHRVFGGSNTKGNVRQTAVTLLDENSGCSFCVDEAYGGGKSAPMDAEAKLLMACIPGLQAAYGGAEAAAIQGNVTLNITNGTFDRVFGGNNISGTINGSITVNIEEIGCRPIVIGELYGGGNQAGYSVYGYDDDGKPVESGTTPLYDDPQVNVMSFTSIGKIFGGGYGDGATMVGNPTVNVNELLGTPATYPTTGEDYDENGFKGKTITLDAGEPTEHTVTLPAHTKGKMGAISEVFGGGNAAKVIGSPTVNIATQEEVYIVKQVTPDTTLPEGCYTRNSDGTYSEASGTASADVTYYEKKTVLGVDIKGNVYGGGNNAKVTGDAVVNVGKRM